MTDQEARVQLELKPDAVFPAGGAGGQPLGEWHRVC
jgi:hypothetical protein